MSKTRGGRIASWRTRWTALPAALALCVSPAAPSLAQAPPPALLTCASGTASAQGETQVTLTFTPRAPGFQIIDNDSDHPSIAFALSSRASAAPTLSMSKGLLRTIRYEQADSVLVLHLAVVGRTHVDATPVGEKAISLKLSPAQAGPVQEAAGAQG